MDDTRIQNLMFLLAAAPIAAGGCIITGDDVASGGSSGTSSPTSSTSGGETDAMTGGATDVMTSDATSVGSTEGPGDTTEGPGDTTAVETTGDSPSEVCLNYADTITYCYDEKSGAAALLTCADYSAQLYKYGADCLTAFEEFYACLATLDCRNFGRGTGCEAELENYDMTCFL